MLLPKVPPHPFLALVGATPMTGDGDAPIKQIPYVALKCPTQSVQNFELRVLRTAF